MKGFRAYRAENGDNYSTKIHFDDAAERADTGYVSSWENEQYFC